MGFFSAFRRLLRQALVPDPKRVFPDQKHLIKYAFTIGGVDYYQYDDIFSLPYERGLMAIAVYEETRMRVSREYLEAHVEAVRDALRGQKEIDLFRVNELNEQMAERLSMIGDVDLLYKLASVVFFDKHENPTTYEQDYNAKKISMWKKSASAESFFLQQPVSGLIPFLKPAGIDLNLFSQVSRQINALHWSRLDGKSKKG